MREVASEGPDKALPMELFEGFVDAVDRSIREHMESADGVDFDRSHNEAEWSHGNATAHVTWLTSATVAATLTLGEVHEPMRTFHMDEASIDEAAHAIFEHLSKASL
jgi:hypothetical protein